MLCELVSRLAPNCGDVSSTILDIAPDVASPETTALLATFFNPPPEVSIAKNTSSFAIVDISDKELTAIELKFYLLMYLSLLFLLKCLWSQVKLM